MPSIEAAKVDAPAIGMRTRLVKALDAAGLAEQMFSRSTAETVGSELVCAAQQGESIVRNVEVQIASFGADRAVAIKQFERRPCLNG